MKKAINILCRISYILDLVLAISLFVLAGYMTLLAFTGFAMEPADQVVFISVLGGMAVFFVLFGVLALVARSLIKNLILPRYNAAKRKSVVKNPAIWAIVLGALTVDTLLVAGILMLAMPIDQLPANSNNQ